ncbi:MAG: tryptophan synthase subunit alpha [Mesosutterella multiformis]|jgi:tryptophan synthase alpha chain|uniref:Tryptophan synthase alpha chain n=1 Tax=Mesosutterella multiformis TaxID=2259133 RepID=A0A388S912_9BURK|nr:tryptophan synthase subunit alpha [Mesosutterella multiformis]MCH3935246.1 tryptophan synthase subunit alpha [Mesosutterella sp.]MCH3936167.1 tryptophan synthase subunit alpha [Mesosutterella sp.]MCI1639171.1 tryptophan synthase subunit alpha [Mesosutterella multiformis]GBO92737.1 tryptophan synthase alpha chain [Mesosutterella multiformis]
MSRLEKRFASLQAAGKKALIPYICAGDPSLESTVPLLHELVRSGASAIELGMPFSDPMADGPVIQRASERAISRGSNLDFVFNCVKEFRKTDSDTPIVLMGYANPVECRGQEAFIRDAAEAGVDGVLIVDYPFDEVPEFYEAVKKAGMDPIFLLAPTSSDERVEQVCRLATGYLYYVSLKGTTGAGNRLDIASVRQNVARIERYAKCPVAVGFGISNGETAREIASVCSGVIIGSALIREMDKTPDDAVGAAGRWLAGIRAALDAA